MQKSNVPVFSRGLLRKGWVRREDVGKARIGRVNSLELVNFLRDKEESISGDELCKRAKELGANLGESDAISLLEHEEEIPEEWGDYFLLFPGTIWENPIGERFIPCFARHDGRWNPHLFSLGPGWHSNSRLLRDTS